MSGRLFVIVHGLAIIGQKQKGDDFQIALPAVDGHVFKAGSWLNETPIRKGAKLTLKNVRTGNAAIRPLDFLVDVQPPYYIGQNGLAATISVPQPKEVLGLLLARNALCVHGKPLQTAAEVVVLVYDYDDENQVYLEKHDWEPYSTGGSINLHLIATSEMMEGKKHQDDTEKALKQVFGSQFPGIDYAKGPLVASWRDPNHPDFGKLNDDRSGVLAAPPRKPEGMYIVEQNGDVCFPLAALEHPASRAQRLNRLGRMHMERRRIESIWHNPDPLCVSDVSVCGPTSGQ